VRWPEVREVKDPASQAVAFYENGRLVVEVDEKLKGRERSRAIWTAMRSHEGRLPALLPFLLLVGWEPIQRWLREHAAVAAMTTAAGSVSLLLLVPTAHHHGEPPRLASPAATITVTAPTPPAGTAPTRTPVQPTSTTPSVEILASEEPTNPERRDPTAAGPTETREEPSTPARSPTRRAATPSLSSSDPETLTPPPQASAAPASPVERRTEEESSAAPVDEPTVAPRPEPTPASAGRDCLLRVDLDPLADACVLG
jgi:hypothetical protein